MTKPAPKVTAVVLTALDHPEWLTADCLDSLARSTYPDLTTLLVDNASVNGPKLHARYPQLPYLATGANLGYTGGNNRGIAWALEHGADYVLVLNNDTIVDPECISQLVSAAQETGAPVVAPLIVYHEDPQVAWYAGGRLSTSRAQGIHTLQDHPVDASQRRQLVTFVTGCCVLVRADVLHACGGFDDAYFAYCEDVEYSLRLGRAGYTLLYEPRARVLHRTPMHATPSPFQIRQRDRNRRRLVRAYYSPAARVRFALWFYPTRLVHLARYLLAGDRARAAAILDGALSRIDEPSRIAALPAHTARGAVQ